MPTEIEIKQVVADILREWEEAVLEHEAVCQAIYEQLMVMVKMYGAGLSSGRITDLNTELVREYYRRTEDQTAKTADGKPRTVPAAATNLFREIHKL